MSTHTNGSPPPQVHLCHPPSQPLSNYRLLKYQQWEGPVDEAVGRGHFFPTCIKEWMEEDYGSLLRSPVWVRFIRFLRLSGDNHSPDDEVGNDWLRGQLWNRWLPVVCTCFPRRVAVLTLARNTVSMLHRLPQPGVRKLIGAQDKHAGLFHVDLCAPAAERDARLHVRAYDDCAWALHIVGGSAKRWFGAGYRFPPRGKVGQPGRLKAKQDCSHATVTRTVRRDRRWEPFDNTQAVQSALTGLSADIPGKREFNQTFFKCSMTNKKKKKNTKTCFSYPDINGLWVTHAFTLVTISCPVCNPVCYTWLILSKVLNNKQQP